MIEIYGSSVKKNKEAADPTARPEGSPATNINTKRMIPTWGSDKSSFMGKYNFYFGIKQWPIYKDNTSKCRQENLFCVGTIAWKSHAVSFNIYSKEVLKY